MTTIPDSPAAPSGETPARGGVLGGGLVSVGQGAVCDLVLTRRAVVDAEHVAGLIVAAELDTAGTPGKLPADLFTDVDPEVVARVWQRALVVGIRAGQMMQAPRFRRDQLARLQGELAEAGHFAMAGLVGRSRRVADRAPEWHPADSEEGRGH